MMDATASPENTPQPNSGKVLCVRLTAGLARRLGRACEMSEMSISALVRNAIRASIREIEAGKCVIATREANED